MISLMLQDFLVEDELPELFEGFTLKNVEGNQTPVNIYSQYLPITSEDTDHFPFIKVILIDGKEENEDSADLVHLSFTAGVYDNSKNKQGYRDSVNIINRIYTDIKGKKILDKRYILEYPVKWIINNDDTYPYFYTTIETYWSVAKMEISNKDLYLE